MCGLSIRKIPENHVCNGKGDGRVFHHYQETVYGSLHGHPEKVDQIISDRMWSQTGVRSPQH